jgi:hypothetical protein
VSSGGTESTTWRGRSDPTYGLAPRSQDAENQSRLRVASYARALASRQRKTAGTVRNSRALAVAGRQHVGALSPGDVGAELDLGLLNPAIKPRDDAQGGQMLRHLCELGDFARRVHVQARFGELSRARLSLLRVEWCREYAECDWLARPADPWDADLPAAVGRRNASMQALHDAIKIRSLLFRVLPELQTAELRAYRYSPEESLELIVSGTVSRSVRAPASVRSLAMRAKLFGFSFWLDEGVLENLQAEECAVNA